MATLTTKFKTIYDDVYQRIGGALSIDWRLLKAIALTESSERAEAIGDGGQSVGLMQVSLGVGESYGYDWKDLLDPENNINAGASFLQSLIVKYGISGGVEAYNLGETKYRKGLRSQDYARKVLDYYSQLKQEFPEEV